MTASFQRLFTCSPSRPMHSDEIVRNALLYLLSSKQHDVPTIFVFSCCMVLFLFAL
ncbi:hypothetical protein AMATHDRAFT_61651 [Amanita thiersii Skay4041]|uniref:Uncharacterized protein n=1 Tax=Amanita thiersii Skay4041 TaxID=703135 RepID=A0A2A9NPA3_9AGAR|nr:hypothetical protein AMATHDRAFT_61651 [Amanita thiersii Skay4041]